jgi:hypothetical protein
MNKERILITVKTYPTLSRKYGETVCTAGIREDGSWVRIYPVPFRRLNDKEKYKKFDWIECRLLRNTADPRPETFRPVDESEFQATSHVDVLDNWRERRTLILKNSRIYTSMQELIDRAKANLSSLATFKPTRILDFVCEEDERDWDPDKVRQMRELSNQYDLFADNTWRETFRVIPKLPYSFSYKFADDAGKTSKLQVLDWETGALFWNCLQSGSEVQAVAKVRQKYLDAFIGKDLHFFLGTTQQFHFVAPNPWVIIGVFPIPREQQTALF